MSDAYVATAALILAASLIETSYVLAYHDELTGIRGRRAFNESLLSLDQQYAIAIVDIDHFKKFNDTYGHHVGDQVLCMVAARLSEVAGDGQAFRCGGEEFAIVFRNSSAKEAFDHLEPLRKIIEKSMFHVRGADRRAEKVAEKKSDLQSELRASHSDRRKSKSGSRRDGRIRPSSGAQPCPPDHLSVTVSIGVAEPSTRYRQPEHVIQAADQALYRAKHKGRNRVELASTEPPRIAGGKRAK
jgi:diguanylate cyclase (GGDEF)-like protein